MVKEDERPMLTKCPNSKHKIEPLVVQVQLLAFTWRNYLELTAEGAKGEYLAPSNNSAAGRTSSLTLSVVVLEEGKSLISKPGQMGLFSLGRQPV